MGINIGGIATKIVMSYVLLQISFALVPAMAQAISTANLTGLLALASPVLALVPSIIIFGVVIVIIKNTLADLSKGF